MTQDTRRFVTSWLGSAVSQYWAVACLLLIWQLGVSLTGVNAIVVPRPIDVVLDIASNPGLYLTNSVQTISTAAIGLILGMAFGTLLAIIAWSSRILSGILVPVGLLLSSVPVVALIPILARLLGYDVRTVLGIVVVISFFPAFVFTSAGLKSLPPGSGDLFQVLGANRWKRFVHLVVPAAVPDWMIALRLSAPPAVLSAMLAEFLLGRSGLGHLFRQAATEFSTDRAFGTSLVATAVSVLCFTTAIAAERRVLERWR